MTLDEYLAQHPTVYHDRIEGFPTRLVVSIDPALWHLDDYTVSSVSCGQLYLLPCKRHRSRPRTQHA